MKRHAFCPEAVGPLESRLALSGATAPLHFPVPSVHSARFHPRAYTPPDRDTATFEINFLTGMIPHHQMAINMSKLAIKYGQDAQVIDLARRIISEQKPEIVRMNRYLAADGVLNYTPVKAPDEMMDLKALGANRRVAFDRAFLTMMIEHHTMAITGNDMGMAGAMEARSRAAQPGIKTLAGNIVSTQTREIGEMRSILARIGEGAMM